MRGLAGTILRINLSTGSVIKEPTDVQLMQKYLGGRGAGNAILFRELAARIDPLGPDNKLIFMTGPLEGSGAPGANKISVSFKSPATNTIFWSMCGGDFAAELKSAGYDGIIVEGKAASPVFLWITYDSIEIRDACAHWGQTTRTADQAIREELAEPAAKIALIGPAGEASVAFACIQAERHSFGRGGCGAVMGSKNLKAIAVKGSSRPAPHDPNKLASIIHKTSSPAPAPASCIFGTPMASQDIDRLGLWSVRNFTGGVYEHGGKLKETSKPTDVLTGLCSHPNCPASCSMKYHEILPLLGANCGIAHLAEIRQAVSLCDLYGMDSVSACGVLSFAMEAYEEGIITATQAYGLDVSFGNGPAMLALLEKIAYRHQGLADVLAQGTKKAGEDLGAQNLAMHVKGLELAPYDPRGCKGIGLTYATSAKGAHHMVSPTMELEIATDCPTNSHKASIVVKAQKLMAVMDSLALCSSLRFSLELAEQAELLAAVTGHIINEADALTIGHRILVLERLFNLREGFGRKDDTLPDRFLCEEIPSGPSAGQFVDLEPLLDNFYTLMGWDMDGIPTASTLKRLSMDL